MDLEGRLDGTPHSASGLTEGLDSGPVTPLPPPPPPVTLTDGSLCARLQGPPPPPAPPLLPSTGDLSLGLRSATGPLVDKQARGAHKPAIFVPWAIPPHNASSTCLPPCSCNKIAPASFDPWVVPQGGGVQAEVALPNEAASSGLLVMNQAQQGTMTLEQVVRLANRAPPFEPLAHGKPVDWNARDSTRTWSARALSSYPEPSVQPMDASEERLKVFLRFLKHRVAMNGCTIDTLVGTPQFMPDRWIRLPWLPFGGDSEFKRFSNAGWVRAWHGTKMEALYSITCYGKLVKSCDRSRGERFFDGTPGVYLYKDELASKVEFYCRFVPLGDDGVLWAHKWEVLVNRADRVKPPHATDQWIQRARTTHLVALWCCGRAPKEMHAGDAFSLSWDPFLEANPIDPAWLKTNSGGGGLGPRGEKTLRGGFQHAAGILGAGAQS